MKLIKKPMIHVIAKTEVCKEGFREWIRSDTSEPNLDSIGAMQGTPLNNLWNDVSDDFAGERLIEFAGRHCYAAWEKGRPRGEYIRNLIDMEHTSVLEHANITFAMQGISRSLTLELIRHRVGIAISQESQRYVDAKDIKFVVPPLTSFLGEDTTHLFEEECNQALGGYITAQKTLGTYLHVEVGEGIKDSVKTLTRFKKRINEAARAHLPNAAETKLTWTANYRLLRHFLFLRGGMGADLEIRRLAVELLTHCKEVAPNVFGDLEAYTPEDEECFGVPIIRKV